MWAITTCFYILLVEIRDNSNFSFHPRFFSNVVILIQTNNMLKKRFGLVQETFDFQYVLATSYHLEKKIRIRIRIYNLLKKMLFLAKKINKILPEAGTRVMLISALVLSGSRTFIRSSLSNLVVPEAILRALPPKK